MQHKWRRNRNVLRWRRELVKISIYTNPNEKADMCFQREMTMSNCYKWLPTQLSSSLPCTPWNLPLVQGSFVLVFSIRIASNKIQNANIMKKRIPYQFEEARILFSWTRIWKHKWPQWRPREGKMSSCLQCRRSLSGHAEPASHEWINHPNLQGISH